MKKFNKPECEVLLLGADVIATSGDPNCELNYTGNECNNGVGVDCTTSASNFNTGN